MGNSTSKNRSLAKNSTRSPQKFGENYEDANESITPFPDDVLLDPRSPNIARTPLAEILAGRFAAVELVSEANLETPKNLLRKRLLRDLGVNCASKEMNLLDPRSPSLLIPRTPINLSFNGDDELENSKIVSIEYNGIIEEASCRNFNEKLANITLDDADYEDAQESLGKDDEFIDSELAAIRKKYLETNFEFVGDDIQVLDDLPSTTENIFRTPMLANATISKLIKLPEQIEMDENISPMFAGDKGSFFGMQSSTPMVASVAKPELVIAKISNGERAMKTKIYEDENDGGMMSETKSAIIEAIVNTPMKKFMRHSEMEENKPRTPLSVLNRRTKAMEKGAQQQSKENEKENDENVNSKLNEHFTPQKGIPNTNAISLSVRSCSSKIPVFKK